MPQNVSLVDQNGNAVSVSGGTQYTDGAAAPTHPIGTELVYNNAGTMTAVSNSAGLPISGSITASNPSVGTDGSAIPSSSTLVGASDGTNLQQLLVESASNRNLRTALYNGANEVAVDASGRLSILSINNALPAGNNVIGHIIADSGSTTAVTSLPALPAGTNVIGHVINDAGTAVIGSVLLQSVSGTALSADVSNTELRVSNYGKSSAAGDTALLVDSTGRVLIGRSATAVYSLASTQTSGSTQNSGDLTVGAYTEISLDINTTAQSGTSPTLQLFYERKGADGIYYVLWQSAVLTVAANTLSTSIGSGMAYNQSLGLTGRLRWVVGGSATPTYTFSANIQGK